MMLKLLFSLLSILIPFLIVWIIIAFLAYRIGKATSLKEGMAKVAQFVMNLCGEKPANSHIHALDENNFCTLTSNLQNYFSVLIWADAKENNDLLCVHYYQSECTLNAGVLKLIFDKFLRDYFNLYANCPMPSLVRIQGNDLYFYYAYSDIGIKWINEQRDKMKSRKKPPTTNLNE